MNGIGRTVFFGILLLLAACDRQVPEISTGDQMPNREAMSQITAPVARAAWFSPNPSFSECHESKGPAVKIEQFVDGYKPRVQEFSDKYGATYKVEVIQSNFNGTDTVWSYYRTQDACEYEEVDANKRLADKYR